MKEKPSKKAKVGQNFPPVLHGCLERSVRSCTGPQEQEGTLAGTLASSEEGTGFIRGVGVHEECPNSTAIGEHDTSR